MTPEILDVAAARPAPAGTLSREVLARDVPSVFATNARGDVSGRYRFIPTTRVLDILEDRGFYPVRAEQALAKDEGNVPFVRHVIRFRHEDQLVTTGRAVGSEISELVLMNSHDRSSAYRIMAGVFRLVCSNGLVVQSANMGSISVRHAGGREFEEQVIDATWRVAEAMPVVMKSIEDWKRVPLEREHRMELARSARELRPTAPLTPEGLLRPRRSEDNRDDLWTTAQVIQENLIRGGERGRSANGTRTRSRPITSVAADLDINRRLWALTEDMAARLI